MAKISLTGFKDPVRRPRFIIWTGVVVLMLAAVVIVALGVTSTRWFCAEGCHKVQDDTIIAYEHSTHAEISCMACHMPVNANPIVFVLHKAEALGELYLTVTNNFELPLNGESHLALTMASTQCTQCHNMKNRVPTPSEGIKIDHAVHAEVNAACTVCHNRVAHKEDFELTLTDPATGEPNKKHADFMSMNACFRCHGLEEGAGAPGECSACHPSDFNLKPEGHNEKEFLPKGHAELAKEMKAEAEAAAAGGHGEEGAEGGEGSTEGTESGEAKESEETSFLGPEKAYASSGGEEVEKVSRDQVAEVLAAQRSHGSDPKASIGAELPSVESVFYCSTCHREQFCTNCHGMEMPHPAEFKEPKDVKDPAGHPVVSKKLPKKCVMCHGENEKTHFCDECHHGTKVNFEYDSKVAWTKQHPKAVAKSGVKSCTGSCHSVKFCSDCHQGQNVVPSSHRQSGWTKTRKNTMTVYGKQPAEPSAKHALEAQKSMESCEVCHGSGGTSAKFCKSCHKLEMPHQDQFRKNHVSGRKTQAVCRNCHSWPELCSNCHHIGSSTTRSWISLHGRSVNKNGTAGCTEKCHEKNDCVTCHTRRKVVPASHEVRTFVRDRSSKAAYHVQLFEKDAETCTYCHKGEAAELPKSKFCNGCHKLPMPHPEGFGAKGEGGEHAKLFQEKKTTKKVCANCHTANFCNSCHHEGASKTQAWVRYHPKVVKKDGAEKCFDCHEETYCSACHVRRAQDIIN